MSRDRFRRVPPRTGDLFAHFGIALEPATEPERAPVVDAAPCRQCGWYVAASAMCCPLCGRPAAPEPKPP